MEEAKGFENLEIYKRTCILGQNIFDLTKQFPSDERYRLSDQLIRSTRKCPANIAEGYGRFHYQENIQFCRIARGSLTESLDHLNVAFECKYIDQKTKNEHVTEINTIIKMLNGYVRYLTERKKST